MIAVLILQSATAFGFDCSSVTTIPSSECKALVKLYKATNGESWSDNTGWLSDSNPCNWKKVRCDRGRVTRLYLQKNNLNGKIPSTIGDLTALKSLQMNNNKLSGSIQKNLGKLKKLQWLRLEGNELTGAIPIQLGKMTNLRFLYISGNKLSGKIPKQLGKLSKLKRLYVGKTELSGQLPKQLGKLKKLEFLLINNNPGLTGPIPTQFQSLESLKFFHLLNTDLCEPTSAAFQTWIESIKKLFSKRRKCNGSSTPSTSLCKGVKIQDNRSVKVPVMSKPGFMQSYTDPAFGVKVRRISNAGFDGVIKTAYNTIQAWNIDESYLILYHTGKAANKGHNLYNGKTYQRIRKLSFSPRDIEEFFWDPRNKNKFYYINKASPNYGDLIHFDVRNDGKTVLANFDSVCGSNFAPQSGDDVQMMSLDGDLIGLRCSKSPVDQTFSYRISTKKISKTFTIGSGTNYKDDFAAQTAPSGKRLILKDTVLDENMNKKLTIDYKGGEHSCLGTNPDGNDALYVVNFNVAPKGCNGDPRKGVGTLVAYDLVTGTCNNIINQDNGYTYPLSDTHMSSLARKAPGWVAMSTVGSKEKDNEFKSFTNNQPAKVLFSEIFLVYAKPGSPTICRLAHHRSHGKKKTKGTYLPYFGEPHPVLSPSGTRILFNSDWYDSGSVDTYVIELPIY